MKQTKTKFIGLGFKISSLVILMLALMASVMVFISYNMYRKESIQNYGSIAVNIASTIASSIDGDQFSEIMKSGNETDYWKTIKTFLEKTETATGAKFVYAVTPEINHMYHYFASAYYDVPIGFAQSNEFFAKELAISIESGKSKYSQIYNAGEDANASYGYLISGFAPIFDSSARVVGAVGVDISVDKALADSHSFGARISFVFVLLTILVAWLIYLYTQKTLGVPITTISNASKELADGLMETPHFQKRNDEIGFLAENFQKMQSTIKGLTFDIESLVREAAKGRLSARAEEDKYSGDWNVLMTVLNLLLDAFDASREAIVDSINYASKIQKNLLPHEDTLKDAFSDYSVIWKPRDIVGGDIYWLKNFNEGTVLCVCDCTGHGTSGALLTMLVVSAFDTTVNEHNYKDTAGIIWSLEQRLVSVFNVNENAWAIGKTADIQEGCDLAVLYIAKDGGVTISAGHTNVFICDGKEVQRIKGQRIFVGEGKIKDKGDIQAVHIPANPDNKFYIASDGLYDQIGGEHKPPRPFGYKTFKQILLENHSENQSVISDKVWQAFESYRGEQSRRDDFELITFKP